MLGSSLKEQGYESGLYKKSKYVAVKVPVFSFEKLQDVDTMLGPEMKSTGECLGIAETFEDALLKGLVAAGYDLKKEGGVLISVRDTDKQEIIAVADKFAQMGFELYGTSGVSLAVPETNAEQEAPSVAITMPSTTVTLAAVGNKATYNEVTATTAQQTLIINAGVTVKKLTVKGGNLKIYGKVEQLVHDAGDTTIYIIKGTEASLPATIDSKFVVQSDVAVLKAAFANGEDFKLSADADITGQSVSVPAGKSVVLDLNGYTALSRKYERI